MDGNGNGMGTASLRAIIAAPLTAAPAHVPRRRSTLPDPDSLASPALPGAPGASGARADASEAHGDDADDRDDEPSKSARKRASHALQSLGERIVELSPEKTAQLLLPERLVDAIDQARRIRAHEGRRRQLQYIGRLMRDVDGAAVAARLDAMQEPHRAAVALQHAAEDWRDRILADSGVITAFAAENPTADTQRLRQLSRAAQRDPQAPRPRRELYRALLEALTATAEVPVPSTDDPHADLSDTDADRSLP